MYINEDNSLNINEIAEKIKKGKRTVERILKALKEQGVLIRVGSDRFGYWKVKE